MKFVFPMILLGAAMAAGMEEPTLVPDRTIVSLSAVKGKIAHTRFLMVENTGLVRVETGAELTGEDAGAFELIDPPEALEPGTKGRWTIAFRPTRGNGLYEAGLRIGGGEGVAVELRAVGLEAFEGDHEPPLDQVVRALGIPVDVGGKELAMSTDAETIGDSVAAGYFRVTGPEKVRVTALARFSPAGETPVGIFRKGSDELEEVGKMGKSTGRFQDAHQALHPPLAGEAAVMEFHVGDRPFGIYMKGHFYTSFTDPEREAKGKLVKHTARIYPVKSFQGVEMQHTWLVGFEEARNGDYQDLLLLVENVEPVTGGE